MAIIVVRGTSITLKIMFSTRFSNAGLALVGNIIILEITIRAIIVVI